MRLSVVICSYEMNQLHVVNCLGALGRALTRDDEIVFVEYGGHRQEMARDLFRDYPITWYEIPLYEGAVAHKGLTCRGPGKNYGIQKASGKFIALLDPNIIVQPTTFKRALANRLDQALWVPTVVDLDTGQELQGITVQNEATPFMDYCLVAERSHLTGGEFPYPFEFTKGLGFESMAMMDALLKRTGRGILDLESCAWVQHRPDESDPELLPLLNRNAELINQHYPECKVKPPGRWIDMADRAIFERIMTPFVITEDA